MEGNEKYFDSSRYISKHLIYGLLTLAVSVSVAASTLIVFVGQAIFYPKEQGIITSARVDSLQTRQGELKANLTQVLSTVQNNASLIVDIKKDLETLNQFGTQALRELSDEIQGLKRRQGGP